MAFAGNCGITIDLPETDDVMAQKAMLLAREMSRKLLKGLKAQGTNIFIANGAAAGQKAPHLIVHIIPRMPGDGLNFMMAAKEAQVAAEQSQAPQPSQSQANQPAESQKPADDEVDLDELKKVLR